MNHYTEYKKINEIRKLNIKSKKSDILGEISEIDFLYDIYLIKNNDMYEVITKNKKLLSYIYSNNKAFDDNIVRCTIINYEELNNKILYEDFLKRYN